MKIKNVLFLFLVIGISLNANAQMKIGYVNIELVMLYMPESKSMTQQLGTYQRKLGEKLQVKQQYAQTKMEEYQVFMQDNPNAAQADVQEKQQDLMKLDEEIKQEASEADQKLLQKRQELLAPIVERLNSNLKSLAAEEGYDYILNTVDGSGVSIVLHGPEQYDLTEILMKRLGIEIPSNN